MMKRYTLHTCIILAVALGLRLATWWLLPYNDWISDEGEYWGAAIWLAQGREFQFFDSWIWTRPPLYISFLAAHIKLFGNSALWAPRLSQALISVLGVWLTMRIAKRLASSEHQERVSLIAGWLMALGYSFATFSYFMLSETLFLSIFLAANLFLLRWASTRHWRDLLLAGVGFGFAALTRAIILTWLPLPALWIAWQMWRNQRPRWQAMIKPVFGFTLSVCVIVLPWTAFATNRWSNGDGLILVDTTGGYNFALGAQIATPDGRNGTRLAEILCGGNGLVCQGSQAARQNQAYAQGFEWLGENPQRFIGKTALELLDILQVRFDSAEHLTDGYVDGRVPVPHLLGLLLDDTLYVALVGLAVLGFWRKQAVAGKGLVLGWLGYNIIVGSLIFAIARFRQPLIPFVIIYAALAIVQWSQVWASSRQQRYAWASAGLLWLIVLPSYLYLPESVGVRSVWQDVRLGFAGVQQANQCQSIRELLQAGDLVAARQLHDRIDAEGRSENTSVSGYTGRRCLALINGQLLEAEAKPEQALAFYQQANPKNNPVQSARILMLEGNLLQRQGQISAAVARFNFRDVEIINDLAWAWDYLTVVPTSTIDLGSGLDYGYVRGFYQSEHNQPDFRWSSQASALRLPQAATGQAQTLRLHLNGFTNDWQPTRISISLNGQLIDSYQLQPTWHWLEIALPAQAQGSDLLIEFASSTFVSGPEDLATRVSSRASNPLRLLGFQLDRVEIK